MLSAPYDFSCYQLALVTPGNRPLDAIFRKHILQMPNCLINALGLPHSGHLLYLRTANFGFLFAFSLNALRAKVFLL